MAKPVILTGLRANNDLHIGNYLGALLPMVDMAKAKAGDYQINLFVPDLHSFTTPIDHSKLQEGIFNALKMFVAAGLPLDNPDINIYRQSYISAHSELSWILDCFTGFGEMSRMTQFKDKSGQLLKTENNEFIEGLELGQKGKQKISVGLFNYPVLMAADILLYGAAYVPVGDDQTQHLEFARDIAERMNNQFGRLFIVPEPVKKQHVFFGKDQGLRIKDLVDPKKKMSKSDATGKGVIFLSDTPAQAKKKIMGATTDSYGRVAYNHAEQPGIGNLLDILALLSGKSIGEVCKEYVGQSQYGPLKAAVAETVGAFLTDFQSKLDKVQETKVLKKLETSEAAMQKQAGATLLRVQQAVGLRPKKS
jgi:tryptophanyl-tRNA synthetase